MIDARFVERPNRFIAIVELTDGQRVEAHVADPGRLEELFSPGAALRLREAPEGSRRRTRFSVALVRARIDRGVWVSVEPARANGLVGALLEAGDLPDFADARSVRREVRHAAHRFDFCLERRDGKPHWIEVKSATLVENGIAWFPDAPTDRGRRHVETLTERCRAGEGATILFAVQRSDARGVGVQDVIDPCLADALEAADSAGVELRGLRFGLDQHGTTRFLGTLPGAAGTVDRRA